MTRIIVIGDSWATGEFAYTINDLPYDEPNRLARPVHPSLSLALNSDGITAFVAGQPSRPNLATLEALRTLLSTNHGVDAVFLFQSDPLRDRKIDEIASQGITVTTQEVLRLFYARIGFIESHYCVPIHLIGGCSDVDETLARELGVRVFLPSLTQMVIPDFTPSVDYGSWFTEPLGHAMVKSGRLDEWLGYSETHIYKRAIWNSPPHFAFDHPTRSVFEQLAAKILSELTK